MLISDRSRQERERAVPCRMISFCHRHYVSACSMRRRKSGAKKQTPLVQADGGVDRGALKYLQQLLGPQAVPIAVQAYNDPRLTDPAKKEPFARVALNFVGTDAQANDFYNKAINDLSLSKGD